MFKKVVTLTLTLTDELLVIFCCMISNVLVNVQKRPNPNPK